MRTTEVRITARQRRRAVWLVAAGLGMLVIAILLLNLAPAHDNSLLKSHARKAPAAAPPADENTAAPASDPNAATNATAPAPTTAPAPPESQPAPQPAAPSTPVPPLAPSLPASAAPPPSGFATSMIPSGPVHDTDLNALKAKALLIPVAGIQANQLRDTFYAGRSEGRTHEALDIMAAGGTPVLAATDGTIVKLFQSDKGGITLYELDPSGLYVYYYAHLQHYADGVSEGKAVRRGDVIAYVGDTGNAGAGNYHLHFAISKPVAPRKWSGGLPINPYPILSGK
jgi:murein DD-endopeptidase MepM/ murein hydrolase activator NlpD